jgi:dimeric dUTPase (all-alpha-NTP-PPase superfamily)
MFTAMGKAKLFRLQLNLNTQILNVSNLCSQNKENELIAARISI